MVLAGLVAMLLSPAAAVAGQSIRYGDVRVQIHDPVHVRTFHGYATYRFTVSNASRQRSHVVRLEFGGRHTDELVLSRTVVVEPGRTVGASVRQPAAPIGYGCDVYVDGERQEYAFAGAESGLHRPEEAYWHYRSSGIPGPACLASRTVERRFDGIGPIGPVGNIPTGQSTELRVGYSERPVEEWDVSWLDYSRFDCVAVTADEWDHLPETVRTALLRYVSCGGVLGLLGEVTPSPNWQPGAPLPAPPQVSVSSGSPSFVIPAAPGSVAPGAPPPEAPEPAPAREIAPDCYGLGFGLIVVSDRPRELAEALYAAGHETAQAFDHRMGVNEAHDQFPVAESLGVPARGMLLLMLGFVVLIGPVTVLYLARTNRRTWLLWTIPAISLLTCGIVFGYSVFSEGFTGRSRVAAWTILDQRTHEATTIGYAGYYSPLTPGGGLRFSADTELTPQWGALHGFGFRGESQWQGPWRIDWTEGQHLQAGWIKSRIPVYFQLRKCQTRRERLTLQRDEADPEKLTIVNGLGAAIRDLQLVDHDGTFYVAEHVEAGQKAALVRVGPLDENRNSRGKFAGPREVFASAYGWAYPMLMARAPLGVSAKPPGPIRAGMYLAVLDAAPFVEEALQGAEPREHLTIVLGILGGAPYRDAGRSGPQRE